MESIWPRHRTSGHSILPSRRAIFAIFSQSDKYGEQVLASSPNRTLPVMRKIPRPFLTWHFFGTIILPYCCWMSLLVRKCSAPNFRTTRVTLNSTSDFSSSSLFLTCPISPMKTTINKEFIIWKTKTNQLKYSKIIPYFLVPWIDTSEFKIIVQF